MNRRKLVKRLVYLIFLILFVNFAANKLYWYSSIWYLDMIMHFLGGFWIGLMSFYIFSPTKLTARLVFKIFLIVLLVGIGWEIFELLVNDVIAKNTFDYLDTISDIIFDVIGGIVSIFYFFKRIMLQSKD